MQQRYVVRAQGASYYAANPDGSPAWARDISGALAHPSKYAAKAWARKFCYSPFVIIPLENKTWTP